MHQIEEILSGGGLTPLMTALVMGLLAATNPCPLATNLSAVLFFAKRTHSPRALLGQSILYALGRLATYLLLGGALVILLQLGIAKFQLQTRLFEIGEHVVGWLMILLGLFFIVEDRLHRGHNHCHTPHGHNKKGHERSAFLIGIVLALAFCPVTAVIFFGVMVPLGAQSAWGYVYFALFSVITVLPVMLIHLLVAAGVKGSERITKGVERFRRIFGVVVGVLFILMGAYLSIVHLLTAHAH